MGIRNWLAVVGVVFLACACSADKKPAEKAFADVQQAVAPGAADMEKYAPDEYAKLNDVVSQMKAKLNDSDYKAVLALRPQAMSQLIQTSGVTAKRKLEASRRLSADWRDLNAAVPKLIADITTRMSNLRRNKQMPAGVTAESLAQAEAQVPSLSAAWTAAVEQAKAGGLDAAVAKGQELRKQCMQVGALVGLRWVENSGA